MAKRHESLLAVQQTDTHVDPFDIELAETPPSEFASFLVAVSEDEGCPVAGIVAVRSDPRLERLARHRSTPILSRSPSKLGSH